jgi:hypothetical protein
MQPGSALKTSRLWIRITLVNLVFVFIFTQCLFAHLPEANFWAERRKTVERLAQLPVPVNQIPTLITQGLEFQLPKPMRGHLSQEMAARCVPLVRALPQTLGTVRRITPAASHDRSPIVIHIQDVHMNSEAQANISAVLQKLIQGGTIDLVALEGVFEPLDFSRYEAYPHPNFIHSAADYLLKESKISGAVEAALKAPGHLPLFIGIDDPRHYPANVLAYQRSAPLMQTLKDRLAQAEASLTRTENSVFNPPLAQFHIKVQNFLKGQNNLGNHLEFLKSALSRSTPEVDLFIEALRLENTLDFPQAERERSLLLEKLSKKLRSEKLSELLGESVAYRLGRIRQAEFYQHLKALCEQNGFGLSRYPALSGYIRYLLLSDEIDAEQLMQDLTSLEKLGYTRFTKTAQEKQLTQEARRLFLSSKLVDFSLTPLEWGEYKKIGAGNQDIGVGTKDGLNPISYHLIPDLSSFESFYEEADRRDQAMSENLIRSMKERGARIAALVTGGFHEPGMDRRLKEAGFSTITFVPKITKVVSGSGTAYLSVFVQEKTPLEKLVAGEKLFVTPDPVQGLRTLLPGLVESEEAAVFPAVPIAEKQRNFDRLETIPDVHLTGMTVEPLSRQKAQVDLTEAGPTGTVDLKTVVDLADPERPKIASANSEVLSSGAIGKGSSLEKTCELKEKLKRFSRSQLRIIREKIIEFGLKVRNPQEKLNSKEQRMVNETLRRLNEFFPPLGKLPENLKTGTFPAVVKNAHDYLLAFAGPEVVGLMETFFIPKFGFLPHLAEILAHEVLEVILLERGTAPDQAHQKAIEILRKIFGRANPIKGLLRTAIIAAKPAPVLGSVLAYLRYITMIAKDPPKMEREGVCERVIETLGNSVPSGVRRMFFHNEVNFKFWESKHALGALQMVVLFILHNGPRKFNESQYGKLENILNALKEKKELAGFYSLPMLFLFTLSTYYEGRKAIKAFIRLSKRLQRLPGELGWRSFHFNLAVTGLHLGNDFVLNDLPDLKALMPDLRALFRRIRSQDTPLEEKEKLKRTLGLLAVGMAPGPLQKGLNEAPLDSVNNVDKESFRDALWNTQISLVGKGRRNEYDTIRKLFLELVLSKENFPILREAVGIIEKEIMDPHRQNTPHVTMLGRTFLHELVHDLPKEWQESWGTLEDMLTLTRPSAPPEAYPNPPLHRETVLGRIRALGETLDRFDLPASLSHTYLQIENPDGSIFLEKPDYTGKFSELVRGRPNHSELRVIGKSRRENTVYVLREGFWVKGELLPLLNQDGRFANDFVSWDRAHRPGLAESYWHPQVHVYVRDINGDGILLETKENGKRGVTLSGHVNAQDFPDDHAANAEDDRWLVNAAVREGREELGMEFDQSRLKRISNINEVRHKSKNKKDNKFFTVFVYHATADEIAKIKSKFNPNQINEIDSIRLSKFASKMEKERPKRMANSTRVLKNYPDIITRLTNKIPLTTLILLALPLLMGVGKGGPLWLLPVYATVVLTLAAALYANRGKGKHNEKQRQAFLDARADGRLKEDDEEDSVLDVSPYKVDLERDLEMARRKWKEAFDGDLSGFLDALDKGRGPGGIDKVIANIKAGRWKPKGMSQPPAPPLDKPQRKSAEPTEKSEPVKPEGQKEEADALVPGASQATEGEAAAKTETPSLEDMKTAIESLREHFEKRPAYALTWPSDLSPTQMRVTVEFLAVNTIRSVSDFTEQKKEWEALQGKPELTEAVYQLISRDINKRRVWFGIRHKQGIGLDVLYNRFRIARREDDLTVIQQIRKAAGYPPLKETALGRGSLPTRLSSWFLLSLLAAIPLFMAPTEISGPARAWPILIWWGLVLLLAFSVLGVTRNNEKTPAPNQENEKLRKALEEQALKLGIPKTGVGGLTDDTLRNWIRNVEAAYRLGATPTQIADAMKKMSRGGLAVFTRWLRLEIQARDLGLPETKIDVSDSAVLKDWIRMAEAARRLGATTNQIAKASETHAGLSKFLKRLVLEKKARELGIPEKSIEEAECPRLNELTRRTQRKRRGTSRPGQSALEFAFMMTVVSTALAVVALDHGLPAIVPALEICGAIALVAVTIRISASNHTSLATEPVLAIGGAPAPSLMELPELDAIKENLEPIQPLDVSQLLPGPVLEKALDRRGAKPQRFPAWISENSDVTTNTRVEYPAGSDPKEVGWIGLLLEKSGVKIRLSVNPETVENYTALETQYGKERLEIVPVPGLMTMEGDKETLHARTFVNDITEAKERLIVFVRTDEGADIDDPESLKGLQGLRFNFFNLITQAILTVPEDADIGELIRNAQMIANNA